MAKNRDPEQRSISGTPSPGPVGAIPTGDEVYQTSRPDSAASAPLTEGASPAEGAEAPDHMLEESLAELRAVASEYFEQLSETAGQLTDQAQSVYETGRGYVRDHPASSFTGAFVVGVLVGLLTGRK